MLQGLERVGAGVWLARKPAGATSFSLVRELAVHLEAQGGKKLKVVHGGALDPFAEGLLPLMVGSATRLFELLHEVPKVYRARVVWGRETDTGDGHGRTVASAPPPRDGGEVQREVERWRGWVDQVPPATSNKRVDGERAYLKAHRGETFTLPAVRVFVSGVRVLADQLPLATELEVVCRGGFYVRSLARELGVALGSRAHLERLSRVSIGPYRVPENNRLHRVEPAELLSWLPSCELSDDDWGRLRGGALVPCTSVEPARWPLPPGFPPPSSVVRVLRQGHFVAVAPRRDGQLLPRLMMLPRVDGQG